MTTIAPELLDPLDQPLFDVAEIPQEPPQLYEIFLKDAEGQDCITMEGLDWIWPTDDREPLKIEGEGKGFAMPPTCPEGTVFVSCEEQHGRETCLKFMFDGPPLVSEVPLVGALPLMLTAVALLLTIKGKRT